MRFSVIQLNKHGGYFAIHNCKNIFCLTINLALSPEISYGLQ